MDIFYAITWVLVTIAIVMPIVVRKTGIKKAEKELIDLYATTIQEQKAKIRQLYGINARLQQQNSAEDEEIDVSVNPLISAIAEKYGIPSELLNDPSIKKLITKYKHLLPIAVRFLPSNNQVAQTPNQKDITYV